MAARTGIDVGQLHRVLYGEGNTSPRVIGKIAGTLPKVEANELIRCYLKAVAAEIALYQLTTAER